MSESLIFLAGTLTVCGVLLAVYERGQRKGLEAAERLYAPLMAKVRERLDADAKEAKDD